MPDGSILMNAFGCGFYRRTGIASDRPKLGNVYTLQAPEARQPAASARGAELAARKQRPRLGHAALFLPPRP